MILKLKHNPCPWHNTQRIRKAREGYGFDVRSRPRCSALAASYLKMLKVLPTAAMSDARHYQYNQGECLNPKQAQFGLANKGRVIIGLVVSYIVWLGSMIYGIGLWTSARCMSLVYVVVRMDIELKYRNTPQIHTDAYQSKTNF